MIYLVHTNKGDDNMISKSKIAYAEKILEMITNDKRAEMIDAGVEMFENCREQGYRICLYGSYDDGGVRTIAFSEHRNSDDIVVYHSSKHEEYPFGYSDEFWANKKGFRYGEYDEAVDYIFGLVGV